MSDTHLLAAFGRRLSDAEQAALALLIELAAARGSALYLVGGSVRDLLLGRAHLDLDLVVETAAPVVARTFAARTGSTAVVHDSFGTAAVHGAGFRFDLVTARRETYPTAGALPVVVPATLADDLRRRDFSINAIALPLSGDQRGRLIDPMGGWADLARGLLQVMHDGSFRDDATRLWRAGRYAARLGLRLSPHTESLARRDRGYLQKISPARINHELMRLFDEQQPGRALVLLDQLEILSATLSFLRCTAGQASMLSRARRLCPDEPAAAMLAVLGMDWETDQFEQAIVRLALHRHDGHALRSLPALRAELARLVRGDHRPSAVTAVLDRYPLPAVAAVAAVSPRRRAGRLAAAYLTDWRHVRPLLDGARLQAIGVPRGPAIGDLLRRLRGARLDGAATSLEDEERIVLLSGATGGDLPVAGRSPDQ